MWNAGQGAGDVRRRGLAASVLLVALVVPAAACGTTTVPSSTPAITVSPRAPVDWVTHVYQRTAIAVPASWTVVNEERCPPSAKVGTLSLGIYAGPLAGASCPAGFITDAPSVTVTPLSSPSSDAVAPPAVLQCPAMIVNGLQVHMGPCGSSDTGGATWWAIPELNVQLVATNSGGSVPETGTSTVVGKVLHTVHRATATEIATRSPLVTHLTLARTRVRAGVPIKGTVTFSNTTTENIEVELCAADGWLNVGLTGNGIAFEPGHLLPACAPSVVLNPGRTAFPVTVLTTYLGCSNSEPLTAAFPMCVASVPPPLPTGAYRSMVITAGLPNETVPANIITVRLTH